MKLAELKKEYDRLAGKYNLPGFKEMNEEFDIQKLQEEKSETLLRDIRRLIVENELNYLRFLESLLNPSNAPLFLLRLTNNLSHDDRKILNNIYNELCKMELNSLYVESEYSEKAEAEFIKQTVEKWPAIKKEMKVLFGNLKISWDKESEKKERSYFG